MEGHTLTKEFSFEAGRKTLTSTPHGNTWHVILSFSVEELDDDALIIDTDDIEATVRPIIEGLHQSFLISQSDSMLAGFVELYEEHGVAESLIETDFNPTIERLPQYIYEEVAEELRHPSKLCKVEMHTASGSGSFAPT